MKKIFYLFFILINVQSAIHAMEVEGKKKNRFKNLTKIFRQSLHTKPSGSVKDTTSAIKITEIDPENTIYDNNRVQFNGYVWLLDHNNKEMPVSIIASRDNTNGSYEEIRNKVTGSAQSLVSVGSFKKNNTPEPFDLFELNHEIYSGLLAVLINNEIINLPENAKRFEQMQAYALQHELPALADICEQLPIVYRSEDALHNIQTSLHGEFIRPLLKTFALKNTKRLSSLSLNGSLSLLDGISE